ncbi:MAG TPA: sulfotransferase domain-containing protein [Candidatus Binatia bacterium]
MRPSLALEQRIERRLLRLRANRHWLRVKSLFLPNVVILSHKRSGFQWFRQICHANMRRHVVMPPGARYQHFNVERVPEKNKLNHNAILLVRDGRDVMVSLYMASTRDGPGGTRRWEGDGTPISFRDFLRTEFMELRNARREVIRRMNPVDYWAKFNADWLASPHIVSIVHYERLLENQRGVICDVLRAFGYAEDEIDPVEVQLDFDRHSPVGRNIPSGYRRMTTGNWRRIFTPDDETWFEARAGATLRALGYPTRKDGPTLEIAANAQFAGARGVR